MEVRNHIHIPKAQSIYKIPTLGPKVYTYDLLWAIWSPRVWGRKLDSGLFKLMGLVLDVY